MSDFAKLLLRTALFAITPKTAEILVDLLLEQLEKAAKATDTDVDDLAIRLLKRFLDQSVEAEQK